MKTYLKTGKNIFSGGIAYRITEVDFLTGMLTLGT